MLTRRTLLASATLALPACTVISPRLSTASATCPPPVRAEANRVIRTVAGLRPYRPAGFVVRAEQLGTKRLVHNYGHGGAGITLSWGTSRLATNLGLPGHAGAVAVVGAGAVGLATARLAQEAGYPVTLYAKALPPETTSNIAGGQIVPASHFTEGMVTPEWRAQYRTAMDYSWRRFQIMVGDGYSIRWVPTWLPASAEHDDGDWMAAYNPALARFASGQHPFGDGAMIRFDTMYVETGRYLERMLADFRAAGGKVVVRDFDTPADLAALPDALIFNCTGLGSHELFGDAGLTPVRGQLAILLPQPEIDYAYAGREGYMFPRPDGIVLGGTFERGVWDATAQPADIADIIAGHARTAAGWRCPA
ncbi:FAD-dependent oxidoreductase [Sphingomonas qomolangmaensis]|uniref:D-amino-acid oxidase n=1 Tax=Sphingomonas qomolangmaensis TaxID=2918765 RepID=A0ABY5L7B1_9SPHN|nr:FAD-dependent oxidoreductase [Sphingomonas qomolangmaensis]UUL81630.1 FAD-binding oxidoreductase [Sphingomonas qomolangmaensis]